MPALHISSGGGLEAMTTISIDQLCADAEAFLAGRLSRKPDRDAPFVWGEGSDSVSIVEDPDPEQEAVDLTAARTYAADRFDAGFGWIDGPVELGGRGLSTEHKRAYASVEARYRTPPMSFFTSSEPWTSTVGPTMPRPIVKNDIGGVRYRASTDA